MTTGRINQIAVVMQHSRHARRQGDCSLQRYPSPLPLRRRKGTGRPKGRQEPESFSILGLLPHAGSCKSNRRGGNREATTLEGWTRLGAIAHGRDVFPLLTHKPSITRRDCRQRRTPAGGDRPRESETRSRDQWFARFDSCVGDRQATQTSPNTIGTGKAGALLALLIHKFLRPLCEMATICSFTWGARDRHTRISC